LEGVNQYLKKGEKSKSKQYKAGEYNINLKLFKLLNQRANLSFKKLTLLSPTI